LLAFAGAGRDGPRGNTSRVASGVLQIAPPWIGNDILGGGGGEGAPGFPRCQAPAPVAGSKRCIV